MRISDLEIARDVKVSANFPYRELIQSEQDGSNLNSRAKRIFNFDNYDIQ